MQYRITHTTSYAYTMPVPVCRNVVLLTPRDLPYQALSSHRLKIRPRPVESTRRHDYFGNTVHSFSIEESHRKLTVTSTCRVKMSARPNPDAAGTPPWEQVVSSTTDRTNADWHDVCQYVFDSPSIPSSTEFADYARQSFSVGPTVLSGVLDLTARIHSDFKYDTKATSVTSSPAEAFRLRRGVCQDFAHVEIACLRSLGIPARYVSGYLRTIPPVGKPRLVGADASHAWLSVWCGPSGWIDVDPTNNVVCGTDHITLAVGRDYTDVAPLKGTFIGGGTSTLKVSVDVAPIG